MLPDDLAMAVATFRFGVIADFVTGARLAYGERERLLREKTARSYDVPGSTKTTVSRATIMLYDHAVEAAPSAALAASRWMAKGMPELRLVALDELDLMDEQAGLTSFERYTDANGTFRSSKRSPS